MEFEQAIVAYARLFEQHLKASYKATGKGLGQKLKSVDRRLHPRIRNQLWRVVQARNTYVHEGDLPTDPDAIIEICEKIAAQFKLPDPTEIPESDANPREESRIVAVLEKLAPNRSWKTIITRDGSLPNQPVVEVDLGWCPEVNDEDLKYLKAFKRLRAVNLDETSVTDAGMKRLGSLERLEALSLCCTRLTDAGLKSLKRLASLRTLDVRATGVTLEGLKQLKDLDHLECLIVCVSNLLARDRKPSKPDASGCAHCGAPRCYVGDYAATDWDKDLPDCAIWIRHYY